MTNESDSPAGARSRRRARPGVLFLFVLSQILVFGVILEVGARLLDPLGISYYPETARLLDEMVLEEPIGYRLPPGLDSRFHGVDVTVNRMGMRDRPVAPEKEPGEFRLLVMGDSVMFSIGVAFEDSVPYRLEHLLNEAAPPGRHYRTLNMGVPSYNTEQELVQLEEVGLSLQPDAAVLLLVQNDIETPMWVIEKRSNWAADFAQRSYAASLGFFVMRMWINRLTQEAPPGSEEMARAGPGDSPPKPRLEAILTSLTKINHELRTADIPFLLVYDAKVHEEVVAAVRALGAREGFAVRTKDVWSDPRWRDEDPAEYTNSAVDSHCNPRGCELDALVLYEAIVDADLLDRGVASSGATGVAGD